MSSPRIAWLLFLTHQAYYLLLSYINSTIFGIIAGVFQQPARHDSWFHPFVFNDVSVIGLTSIGRVTIQVLAMNDTRRLELRAELLKQSKYKKGLPGDD